MKKGTLAQVFSYAFYEISKNTFFYRTPTVATFPEAYFELGKKLCENSYSHEKAIKEKLIDVGQVSESSSYLDSH